MSSIKPSALGFALLQSGYPLTVPTASAPTSGTALRADVVSGAALYPVAQSPSPWLKPAALTTPQPYNSGDVSRNILWGPRAATFDMTAKKKFLFTEARRLWFGAEFPLPASAIGSKGMGSISGTARTPRKIQFALKPLFRTNEVRL
jgi:hypothetical protein